MVRWCYAPVMLLGFNGAALLVIDERVSHLWLLALLGVAVGASFAAERLIPYNENWNHTHDDAVRDVVHAAVNETFALLSVLALPAIASAAALTNAWPRGLPLVVQVAGTLLVFDLGITAAHWLSHKWGPLWRLHAVHHSVKRSYGLNGLMKHPLHHRKTPPEP